MPNDFEEKPIELDISFEDVEEEESFCASEDKVAEKPFKGPKKTKEIVDYSQDLFNRFSGQMVKPESDLFHEPETGIADKVKKRKEVKVSVVQQEIRQKPVYSNSYEVEYDGIDECGNDLYRLFSRNVNMREPFDVLKRLCELDLWLDLVFYSYGLFDETSFNEFILKFFKKDTCFCDKNIISGPGIALGSCCSGEFLSEDFFVECSGGCSILFEISKADTNNDKFISIYNKLHGGEKVLSNIKILLSHISEYSRKVCDIIFRNYDIFCDFKNTLIGENFLKLLISEGNSSSLYFEKMEYLYVYNCECGVDTIGIASAFDLRYGGSFRAAK